MLSAGGSFQWLRNTLFGKEIDRLRRTKKDPGQLYPAMIEEAAHAPAGCEGLVFLPYLTGERCPYPDPQARGAWVGLTVRHGRSHMMRAVLEGITFGMRDQIDLPVKFIGIGERADDLVPFDADRFVDALFE